MRTEPPWRDPPGALLRDRTSFAAIAMVVKVSRKFFLP